MGADMTRTFIKGVVVKDRVTLFADEQAAGKYANKWGGAVLTANEPPLSTVGSTQCPPTRSPELVSFFGLPANATRSEFETVWLANGCRTAPRNARAIVGALVRLCQRERNFSEVSAESFCQARYPKLFR
jgi:hypothetical protein